MFVGIDVAKDRLDVHLRPSGEAFVSAASLWEAAIERSVGKLRFDPAEVLAELERNGIRRCLTARPDRAPPRRRLACSTCSVVVR